jgi:hypothetical protein
MGDFIVAQVANFWAVTYGEVMFVKRPTAPQAIAAAVENAHRASQGGTRTCVVLDDPGTGPRVVWDSARDGFSKG